MPPRGVKKGTKRARQYQKIKSSARKRGASASRAKEMAARTVGRVANPLEQLDEGCFALAPGRPALRHEPPEGTDQGAAL